MPAFIFFNLFTPCKVNIPRFAEREDAIVYCDAVCGIFGHIACELNRMHTGRAVPQWLAMSYVAEEVAL